MIDLSIRTPLRHTSHFNNSTYVAAYCVAYIKNVVVVLHAPLINDTTWHFKAAYFTALRAHKCATTSHLLGSSSPSSEADL